MPQTAKPRRRSRLARTVLVLGSAAALTAGLTGSASAGVLDPLPWNASTCYLAASRHGGYSTHPINEVPMDTDAWCPGNHWDTPALVTMEQMDKTPRDALWNSQWGRADFPLTNNLVSNINKARPDAVPAF